MQIKVSHPSSPLDMCHSCNALPDNYTTLCSVDVNLSALPRIRLPKSGQEGGFYYQANFDIVLLFGLTELKAQVAWMERVRSLSMRMLENKRLLIKFATYLSLYRVSKKGTHYLVGIRCLFRVFLD
jgi:hypothetical protein